MAREAPALARMELTLGANMRYVGQSYAVDVAVDSAWLESGRLDLLAAAFHTRHEQLYAHAEPSAPIEILDVRVRAAGHLPPVAAHARLRAAASTPGAVRARELVIDVHTHAAVVYERGEIPPGHAFAGPAVVEQEDTTTIVPPGWRFEADSRGNLVLSTES
jgi:N-methylhydantoinase A